MSRWDLQIVLDHPRLLGSQDNCHLPALRPAARTLVLPSSACAVWYRSRGRRQYAHADWPVPRDLSRVSTIERHHRIRDQLERPRRKRGQRRSELRATIGRGIGCPTPLATEHHGDEHLKPLQATAAASMAAAVMACACVPWG